ncbi:MAG: IS200/IS605 family transposase [Muribaculaceae bacterium]|nr:IS200/IS605 family transposase [Muribaculaceae bacterium]
MSKVCALYHIVFCTKQREMTLPEEYLPDVYRFIWSVIDNNKCRLLRIGGIGNHVHILLDLTPARTLSDVVREIKSLSSGWLKKDPRFPMFRGWAAEYYAKSVSPEGRTSVTNYIKTQKEHHSITEVDSEFRRIASDMGVAYDSGDLM